MVTVNGPPAEAQKWRLRLYVVGTTPRSVLAYNNLVSVCEENLQGRYTIEVIDIQADPRSAVENGIVAAPTLEVCSPPSPRRLVGTLSDRAGVLLGLGIRSWAAGGSA